MATTYQTQLLGLESLRNVIERINQLEPGSLDYDAVVRANAALLVTAAQRYVIATQDPKCESCGSVGTHCIQNEGDPSVGYGGGEYWFCDECFEGRK